MKGLILKDLYMIRKHLRMYLVMTVGFLGLALIDNGNTFFVFYPCIISSMIPATLLAYDEQAKWDVYSACLPCSRKQIVSAKYLTGLMVQLSVIFLIAVSQGIRMAVTGQFALNVYLDMLFMLISLSGVASSLSLPLMFKLGVEKGRLGYYIMIGVAAGGSGILAGLSEGNMGSFRMPQLVAPVLALVAAGIYGISWLLSIRFYEKRELR